MGLSLSNQAPRRQGDANPDPWNLLSGENSRRGWATERAPMSRASSQGLGCGVRAQQIPAAITHSLMLWCGVLPAFWLPGLRLPAKLDKGTLARHITATCWEVAVIYRWNVYCD